MSQASKEISVIISRYFRGHTTNNIDFTELEKSPNNNKNNSKATTNNHGNGKDPDFLLLLHVTLF